MSQHSPGNFNDKRGKTKPSMAPLLSSDPKPFFAEDFKPARGYALLEYRFIGGSTSLHIPDSVHEEQQHAIVVSMGEGKLHYNGTVIPPEWKAGDFVYAVAAQGRKVQFENRKLVLLGTEHILGSFPTVPQAVLDEFSNEKTKGTTPSISIAPPSA